MTKEEQMAVYEGMHREWLSMPMTQMVLKAIDNFAANHSSVLQRDALNENVPDSKIRGLVISLQNTSALRALISTTPILMKNIQQEKE